MSPTIHKAPAISQITVLSTTWTDCPKEVRDDVSKLWANEELGNDNYYYSWSSDNEFWDDDKEEDVLAKDMYPKIYNYLKDQGVTDCLIHYWW